MAERITKTIVARYQADTKDMLAGLKSIDASAAQLARSMTALEKTTGLFFKALSGYYALLTVKEIITGIGGAVIEAADAMKQFEVQANRLAGTTAGFDLVVASAQRVKLGFDEAFKSINSLGPALAKLGVPFQNVLKFTEDLVLSFRTFGIQAKYADATLVQLAQAFSAGSLQGDELKSLAENAGGLYAELEKVVNQTLGTSESLRVLGSEGKLSADLIYESFNRVFEGLRDDFAGLPETVAQGWTVFKNEMSLATSALDEMLGITDMLAAALGGIADAARYVRVELMGDTAGLDVDELKTQLAAARTEMEAARAEAARLDDQYQKLSASELLIGKGLHLAGLTVQIDDANRAVTETTERVIEISKQLAEMEKAANGAAGGFRSLKDGMTDAQFQVYSDELKGLQEQLEKTKRALQVEDEGEGWVRLQETFDKVADLPAERANAVLALTQATLDAEQELVDVKAEKAAQIEQERELQKQAADALREQEQLEKQAARERQQALDEQARAQEKLRGDAMQYYYDTLTMEEKHANSVKVVEKAYADGLVTFAEYSRAIEGLNQDLAQYQQDQAEKATKEQEKLAKSAAESAKQYDAFGNEVSTVYDMIKDGAEEAASAIQNNLADAFYRLFTGTLDTAADWMEQFKKIVLQAIAQLVAALISSQIVVPIIAQIIPVSGGVAGVAGAVTGGTGGTGGVLDMLGGGNPLSGMTSWIGGGIATGLEAFGVPTGMATGIGAMAGTALGYGAAGYAVGSLVGGPDVGMGAGIGSAIGSVVGSVVPVVGTVIGGVVGGVIGGAIGALVGDTGSSAKGPTGTGVAYLAVENGQIVSKGAEGISDPQGYIDAISAMNSQIQEMAAQMPGGAGVLQGINIGAQEVTPETFDAFMEGVFGQITSQLGNNLGGLFADAWKQAGGNFDQFLAFLDQIEQVKVAIVEVSQANVFEGFENALQSSVVDQIAAVDERIRMLTDPATLAELEELYNLSQSRYQMEIEYLLQLESIMEGIQAKADAAREQILLTGTSEQQQYEYYREQANAALTMLESAATPEEIALYSDRAMGYLMQSYQTLPEDLQAQYKAEFLSLIDYIEQVSGERAQAAAEVSMEQYNATMAILAETQYQSTYLNGIQRDTTQMNAELVEIKNTLKTQRYSY